MLIFDFYDFSNDYMIRCVYDMPLGAKKNAQCLFNLRTGEGKTKL